MNQARRDPLDFVVGDRLPGTKWVMRGTLGEGGMGLVLDVVKEPGIQGAMKVMLPEFARQPELVDRFFEEARLLAQLRHPNIVQVFDFDQLDDGTPYVVMERLLGVTLRAGMRNLRQKGTPISARLIYEITRQLCEGLFRAHSNTPVIVHGDVKPENVFFHQPPGADTVVKVIDFGIAGVLDGARDRRGYGTPRYMAPEQIDGRASSPATDVYAVALVLYELLTGRFPWDIDLGDEPAVVEAHLHRPPTPPSRYTPWVPELVDQWILRSLSKDPGHRPQDAYQFVAKLYQLQFVGDGTSDPAADIRPAPLPLARLAEAVAGAAPPLPYRAAPTPALAVAESPPPAPYRAVPPPAPASAASSVVSAPVGRKLQQLPPRLPGAPGEGPGETVPAHPTAAISDEASTRGRVALLPAAIGASLVVGLFVAILYLNRPKAPTPLVSSAPAGSTSETPPQSASATSLRAHGRDPLHVHP